MESPSAFFANRAESTRGDEMTTSTPNMKLVRAYMTLAAEDHIEPYTREINCTRLAEDAAEAFGCKHWLDDETHWIWRQAFSAAEEIAVDLELGPTTW